VRTVRVDLAGRSYEVVVGQDLLGAPGPHLGSLSGRAFLITDQTVASTWGAEAERGLRTAGLDPVVLQVAPGERSKTLRSAEALYQQMAVHQAHRGDAVVALGGGVVGDLAGFVAATYMRGVPLVHLPTTLLAQVDAAVGGKTAVNLPEGKNLVGAFHQPVAVLADVGTLQTLPDREFTGGLAEVAKYGFALDPTILEALDRHLDRVLGRDPTVLEDLVARCVAIKAGIVAEDERDAGRRLLLNYGHTLGHALERLDGFAGRSHGEAVSVGMVFASEMAERVGVAERGTTDLHRRVLERLGLPTTAPRVHHMAALEAMRMDKKFEGGLRFVLVQRPGKAIARRLGDGVVEESLRAFLGDGDGLSETTIEAGGGDPAGDA
jgi:3-dehydroquinate synthase